MSVSRWNRSLKSHGSCPAQAGAPGRRCSVSRVWGRFRTWIQLIPDRLFGADDLTAIQHGWEIERGRLGLSRTYRDPRFDMLASCGACHGRGWAQPGRPCLVCGGTGRVTLGPSRDDWWQAS